MKSAISFRIITILVMLLGSLSSVFAADRFYLDPVIIRAGESMSLAFKLDNSLEYFGFQADISLPQGLDIVKNIEGKPECFLSDRAYDYSIVSNLVSESLLRVGAFSNKHTAISGSSGTLLFINVNATNSFVGGVLTINNVMFTQSDNKDIVFSGTTVEIQKYVSVENITLNEESATLKVGDSVQLSATIQPDNATDKSIVWTSSDESVASVTNDGMVTALKVGETVITAKSTDGSDISASCKVNVVTTLVTSILIDKSEWSGKVGDTILLTATVQPEDATDKSIIWTSSDESVASVTNEGLVTAVKVGEAVITAKSTDGSVVSALCKISVLPTLVTSISIDRSEWSGKVGDTIRLTATVQPEDATDKSIVWTSSDESVTTVTNEGIVTAVKVGETVITATSTDGSGISASCNITVLPILVESISISPEIWNGIEGESFQLNVTILPEDATNKTVSYSSSDDSVAQVDHEGLVSVLNVGNCKIMVSTLDGSNLTAECIITSSSGIDEIFIDGETSWNVYDLNGAVLKNNCDKEALKLLSSGIYILQSGDKTIKIIIR